MLVEDKNHRVELEQKMQEQVANGLFCIEIGNAELSTSVAPNWFGLTKNDRPV